MSLCGNSERRTPLQTDSFRTALGPRLVVLCLVLAFPRSYDGRTDSFTGNQGAAARTPSTIEPATIRSCLLKNGLAYGPFRDGQGPGDPLPFPTADQIDEDLTILQ